MSGACRVAVRVRELPGPRAHSLCANAEHWARCSHLVSVRVAPAAPRDWPHSLNRSRAPPPPPPPRIGELVARELRGESGALADLSVVSTADCVADAAMGGATFDIGPQRVSRGDWDENLPRMRPGAAPERHERRGQRRRRGGRRGAVRVLTAGDGSSTATPATATPALCTTPPSSPSSASRGTRLRTPPAARRTPPKKSKGGRRRKQRRCIAGGYDYLNWCTNCVYGSKHNGNFKKPCDGPRRIPPFGSDYMDTDRTGVVDNDGTWASPTAPGLLVGRFVVDSGKWGYVRSYERPPLHRLLCPGRHHRGHEGEAAPAPRRRRQHGGAALRRAAGTLRAEDVQRRRTTAPDQPGPSSA